MRGNAFWAAVMAAAQTLVVAGCAERIPPPVPPGGAADEQTTATGGAELGAAGLSFPTLASAGVEPDSATEAAFPIAKVTAAPAPALDAPSRGPADAPVTIQIFSDFECPYCALAAPVVRAIENEFGASIRVVWRNFPLPMHSQARLAAAAALEVYAERGGAAFWRFHDALFSTRGHGLEPATIERLARQQGVDPARYRQALDRGIHDARIEADLVAGSAAGVDGTPAFFVNDWLAIGVLPYDEFRAVVLRALRDKGL